MANEEHLKILQGVAAWNDWRQKRPELIPDLRKANLSGADLNGVNLREAQLSGADLFRANSSVRTSAVRTSADLN